MHTIVLSEKNEDIRSQQRRLYCLGLAAQTYQMSGRMDGLIMLAGEYEKWVLQPATQTLAPVPELHSLLPWPRLPVQEEQRPRGGEDDAGPIAPEASGGRDTSHDVGAVQDGGAKVPPSLRQTRERAGDK